MVVALNFPLTKEHEFSILDCNVSAKFFVILQLHRRGFLGSLSHTDIWEVPGQQFILSHLLLFQKPSKGIGYAYSNAFDTFLKWWPAEPFKSNWILHPSQCTVGTQGMNKLCGFPRPSRPAEMFWISSFTHIKSPEKSKIHAFISGAGWTIVGDSSGKKKKKKKSYFVKVCLFPRWGWKLKKIYVETVRKGRRDFMTCSFQAVSEPERNFWLSGCLSGRFFLIDRNYHWPKLASTAAERKASAQTYSRAGSHSASLNPGE